MLTPSRDFSLSTQTSLSFEACLNVLRKALSRAGFRILAEIPFHQEFERYVGLRWPNYTVLIAWSPFMAYQAVVSDRDAGLFMPFHVVVGDGGKMTFVAATNQALFGQTIGTLGAQILARDINSKIRAILSNLPLREEPANERSA